MSSTNILVVDDEPAISSLLKEILEDEGFSVTVAKDGHTARQKRREQRFDLVLLDIWMPDVDGITLLQEWRESGFLMDSQVIMISGHGTVETAVEATRLGAYDFIEKPLSTSKLLITIERALEMAALQRENKGLRNNTPFISQPLGHSTVMSTLREQVKRINQHQTPVLITGESGSGRTLFARYIHQTSSRQKGPFVNMRVTGMNPENQALELFGHQNSPPARLEQAEGGTLFIKDIVDMDETIQARLLNSLENQIIIKNGSNRPISINVRLIAATSEDIESALASGRLREDFYYYLNVVTLHLPPLREHCEDVPELLNFYLNLFANQESLSYRRFTVAAQNRLRNYLWPGNVRELKNLVQRLLMLGNHQNIDIEEIEPILNTQQRPTLTKNSSIYDLPLREAREQFERAYLEHQLQAVGGNVSQVASRIGLERTHLYRKLRALDIDPKQTKK
jgi:two-component system nitrogen regulation response regulator NtrX